MTNELSQEQSRLYSYWFPILILTVSLFSLLETLPLFFIHPFKLFAFYEIFSFIALLELLGYILIAIYSFLFSIKYVLTPSALP